MQKFYSKAISITGSILLLAVFFMGTIETGTRVGADVNIFKAAFTAPTMAVMFVNRVAASVSCETHSAKPAFPSGSQEGEKDTGSRLLFLLFNALAAGGDSGHLFFMFSILSGAYVIALFIKTAKPASGGMPGCRLDPYKSCFDTIALCVERMLEYLCLIRDLADRVLFEVRCNIVNPHEKKVRVFLI